MSQDQALLVLKLHHFGCLVEIVNSIKQIKESMIMCETSQACSQVDQLVHNIERMMNEMNSANPEETATALQEKDTELIVTPVVVNGNGKKKAAAKRQREPETDQTDQQKRSKPDSPLRDEAEFFNAKWHSR